MVNIVIKIDKKQKEEFYKICRSLDMTPMRTILLIIQSFVDGSVNANDLLSKYKIFKENDKDRKTQRLLINRIDGTKAYAINKKRKETKILTEDSTSDIIV